MVGWSQHLHGPRLKAVGVGVQMGRAADTVPGELWAGLAQAVDAAGAKAILPGQLLGFLLEQLDRAASGNMPQRASSISRLFATQADEASLSLWLEPNGHLLLL